MLAKGGCDRREVFCNAEAFAEPVLLDSRVEVQGSELCSGFRYPTSREMKVEFYVLPAAGGQILSSSVANKFPAPFRETVPRTCVKTGTKLHPQALSSTSLTPFVLPLR